MKLWRIELNNGDWFLWFAKSKQHAFVGLIYDHYPEMQAIEFFVDFEPRIIQVSGDELISAEVDGDIQTRTAKAWCKNETAGPFSSNTYEV